MYYLPTYLILYNTLDSDVALAYLPTVTIVVVDMIMSLVLDHENKKLTTHEPCTGSRV